MPTSGTLATTANTVASFSAGTTGLTPSTATTGAVTLAGTLAVANGGTGSTTSTGVAGSGVVLATSPTLVTPNFSSIINTGTLSLPTTTDTLVGQAGTVTLTNKRVTPRIQSTTSGATITPTGDTADQYEVTALAVTATIAAPSGTPTDGQRLILRIKDNGTRQTLSWTTTSGAYRAVGVTLPTTTTAAITYAGCIYNSADSFWDVVAIAQV